MGYGLRVVFNDLVDELDTSTLAPVLCSRQKLKEVLGLLLSLMLERCLRYKSCSYSEVYHGPRLVFFRKCRRVDIVWPKTVTEMESLFSLEGFVTWPNLRYRQILIFCEPLLLSYVWYLIILSRISVFA